MNNEQLLQLQEKIKRFNQTGSVEPIITPEDTTMLIDQELKQYRAQKPAVDTSGIDAELQKYRASQKPEVTRKTGILSKIGEATGIKGFGEAIGQAIAAPKIAKEVEQSQQQLIDAQSRLLERIKQRKLEGADTTRLDAALQDITSAIQQQGAEATKLITNDITDEDIIGDALRLAGTVAGAASIPGVSTAAKGAKGVIKGFGLGAAEGAISGGISGAIGGAGTSIKDQQDIGVGVGGALSGGLTGAIGGGILGGVTGGVVGGLTKGTKVVKNVDTLIKQTDEAIKKNPALAREIAEGGLQPTILEKWAGVSPDVKNRIAGKGDQLKEYFDVAHARNNLDTVPTPLEYGATKVQSAVDKMDELINDQGSKIGSFRKKISTYKANIDDVDTIESNFNNELSKLNLEVKNGVIRKKPGTVTKVNSDAEISALNELYGDLQTVKQSPDLERLIDLRQLFDSKINFAKASRDVSSSLDPLSRSIRASIANTAKKIVGKSEAANVQKYADFIEGYTALRQFTDKRTGAEFLLKQALSERGRLPREVMDAVKEFTGIDLMDDATMATIATDLIGNTRQKGLFRQEVMKAGLDAEAILSGRQGAISTMLDWAKDRVIDKEKQFLKAAGGS